MQQIKRSYLPVVIRNNINHITIDNSVEILNIELCMYLDRKFNKRYSKYQVLRRQTKEISITW